ncbi:hypothetical protein QUF80_07950 [Desulfococcaceae bacterium HSG8]|nr:hypothetical protein [Desulfococcaceae bacterium HSG8]
MGESLCLVRNIAKNDLSYTIDTGVSSANNIKGAGGFFRSVTDIFQKKKESLFIPDHELNSEELP